MGLGLGLGLGLGYGVRVRVTYGRATLDGLAESEHLLALAQGDRLDGVRVRGRARLRGRSRLGLKLWRLALGVRR